MSAIVDRLECRLLFSRGPVPLAPSALSVSAEGAADVRLTFNDNSKNESGFVVERSTAGGAFAAVGTLPGSRGRGGRVFDDTTVSARTSYAYRVRAVIGRRSSLFGGPVSASTPRHARPSETARNLLFFGNSFTLNNDVPTLVADIAVADNHPAPQVHLQASNGWTLTQHLDKVNADGSSNIIDASLPAGENWDDVILQDLSTRPTSASAIGGDVNGFMAAVSSLFSRVTARSPQVQATLVETWARGASNPFYPGTFASPTVMQNQLQQNYNAAAKALNTSAGKSVAAVAPAGEIWRGLNWNRNLYDGADEYHPSPRGSLLAAMAIYTTLYHDGVSDIPASRIAGDLTRLGLTAADWTQAVALADAANRTAIATP